MKKDICLNFILDHALHNCRDLIKLDIFAVVETHIWDRHRFQTVVTDSNVIEIAQLKWVAGSVYMYMIEFVDFAVIYFEAMNPARWIYFFKNKWIRMEPSKVVLRLLQINK